MLRTSILSVGALGFELRGEVPRGESTTENFLVLLGLEQAAPTWKHDQLRADRRTPCDRPGRRPLGRRRAQIVPKTSPFLRILGYSSARCPRSVLDCMAGTYAHFLAAWPRPENPGVG